MKTNSAVGSCQADAEQSEESWMQRELVGCQFKDERLGKRFRRVLKQLSEATAESMPLACQDWTNTKAAYRFFANERVSEADIWLGTFARRGSGSRRSVARCWCCTTRPSSPIDVKTSGCSIDRSMDRAIHGETRIRSVDYRCIRAWS